MSDIAPGHVELLARGAISLSVARSAGVRSVATAAELPPELRWVGDRPGLLFPWRSPAGVVVEQFRPDEPVVVDGEQRRYLWPKGQPPVLNVHPTMATRLAGAGPLHIVEGTKQHLAAVTAADYETAVVGIAGCYGWLSDGAPIGDLSCVSWGDREVVVFFDADIARNVSVWDAAHRLGDELELRGAASVAFVQLPANGNEGLDDVLASRADAGATASVYAALTARAGKLPRRPKPAGGQFFGPGGLKAERLLEAVRASAYWATDPAGRLLAYRDGVYVDNRALFVHAIAEALGDDYRPAHARAVEEVLIARLEVEGRVVRNGPTGHLVNVANGLLDPMTGALHPHSPEHLSAVQLPVMWDPDAHCPTFDAWLEYVTAGRGDDLLEACSLMLDGTSGRQRKPIFLNGPTRSAKSTFVRILERITGPAGRSAVTLHELATDRFAAADLYGKILNAAADLSAAHIDDLSRFKAVTGDDPIRAQHKFGRAFVFHSTALFVFSANEVPTVGEVSRAYLARVRPYAFPHTFEGRERPDIEAAIMGELPGVLVRLVEALRRFHGRGDYADTAEAHAALDDFARRSDRVRLFLFEATDADPDGFTERGRLWADFDTWCQANNRQKMGRHRFYETVELAGFRAAKREGVRGFAGLSRRVEEDWGAPDEPDGADGADGAGFPSPRFARGLSDEEEEEGGGRAREGGSEPAPAAPDPASSRPDPLADAVAQGRRTGHVAAPCDVCGERTMLNPLTSSGAERAAPKCKLTPGCDGHHVVSAADIDDVDLRPPPPQAQPPRRTPKRRLLGPQLAYPALESA